MISSATTPDEYVNSLPDERKEVIESLRSIIKANLPEGFTEVMQYGVISYVVPLSIYPHGYLGKPDTPLPFMSIASQKGHIAVCHMGLVADKAISEWFVQEYAKQSTLQLDMGKSCVRLKNLESIPYSLIGQLATKITPAEWVLIYEHSRNKRK